jgi:hypothetical protein
VSTRPACFTAVTSVDSTGLAEAAVATGAVDIPLKLPAPDLGTDAQPEPKLVAVVEAEPDGMAEAIEDDDEAEGADEAAEDEVPELPELQAARPRVRPAADTVTARIRRFTISPKVRSVSICSVRAAGFRPVFCTPGAGGYARVLGRPRGAGRRR